MIKLNKVFFLILIATMSTFFIIGCGGDDGTVDPIDDSMNPPSNLKVVLSANPGGGSIAQITWTSSPSEASDNFSGYVVVTDSVTANGTTRGTVDSTFLNKSEADFINISSLERGVYYQTRIYGLGNDGRKSSTVETIVYAGVYSNTGTIDEYSPAYTSAQSGYAWDTLFFGGSQLPFSSSNYNIIDLHLRAISGDLNFVSPNSVAQNARQTLYAEVPGNGKAAYDLAEDLPEPTQTQIRITADKVYLLKTQNNFYIKIWVKSISQGDFKTVDFEYKAQPISGLKVLKN